MKENDYKDSIDNEARGRREHIFIEPIILPQLVAPFRIEPSPHKRYAKFISSRHFAMMPRPPSREVTVKYYLDKLIRMIPGEVISLYLVGSGLIPKSRGTVLIVWSVVCLVGVLVVRVLGTRDPKRGLPAQWGVVCISMGAFVIWLYAIGGPFTQFTQIHDPVIGSLLVLVWTFFVPYFYEPHLEPLADKELSALIQQWQQEQKPRKKQNKA